jgi:lysozyme
MSTQTVFITKIATGAQAAQRKYGVLASVTISQAILESGWGQHTIANNLFGIKANGTTGATVTVSTKEFVNGEYVNIQAAFRAYPSLAASVEDHGKFLASNSRYKNMLGCRDYSKVCQLLQQDGYATEPDYASQLIALIKQYGLNQYDGAAAAVAAKHIEAVKSGTYCIRSKPSTASMIYGYTKSGQSFVTTVLASGWRQISYNGKTAYIGVAAFK